MLRTDWFLRGGLSKSEISLVVDVPGHDGAAGSESVRFGWLENEDVETVVDRFDAYLSQFLSQLAGRPFVRPTLVIEKLDTSADSADKETLASILGILERIGLDGLQCKDTCAALPAKPVQGLAEITRLDVSSCGLSDLPDIVTSMPYLLQLNLSNNRLSRLPGEIAGLQSLEHLKADNNTLAALPDSLKGLSALTLLSLLNNQLKTPTLDLSQLSSMRSLHLGGNPLSYFPELSHAKRLHQVSLSNLSISSDPDFTSWEVQLAPPASSMRVSMRPRTSATDTLLTLLFRRSCEHPLLAGGLAELAQDSSVRESMVRVPNVLPQLVHLMLSADPIVVVKVCTTLGLLAQEPDGAAKLEQANAISAIHKLLSSGDEELLLAGAQVLTAMAVASDDIARRLLAKDTVRLLAGMVTHSNARVCSAGVLALSNLAFPAENKVKLLNEPGLLSLLEDLAMHDSDEPLVRSAAVRALAVLGQHRCVDAAISRPLRGKRGLRILTLDGGGMKGMAEVTMLRAIEQRTGRRLHELFDLVGGTSTGCMIAVGCGIMRFTLDEIDEIYTKLGSAVFARGADDSAPQASWTDALMRMYKSGEESVRVAMYGAKHDSVVFEQLLREKTRLDLVEGCLDDAMIDAAGLGGPQVFGVASECSVAPVRPFVFRTYEFPPGAGASIPACAATMHAGTSKFKVWQTVRASCAAPYYLEGFNIADYRFQDGAVTVNNPAVVAVQEARMLFPGVPIECVVSLGVGNAPAAPRTRGMSLYLESMAAVFESAVTTMRVHEALAATLDLSGCLYARFQPEDERCDIPLDCTNPDRIRGLVQATEEYLAANPAQLETVCTLLTSGLQEEETQASPKHLSLRERPGVLLLLPHADPPYALPPMPAALLAALRALPDVLTVHHPGDAPSRAPPALMPARPQDKRTHPHSFSTHAGSAAPEHVQPPASPLCSSAAAHPQARPSSRTAVATAPAAVRSSLPKPSSSPPSQSDPFQDSTLTINMHRLRPASLLKPSGGGSGSLPVPGSGVAAAPAVADGGADAAPGARVSRSEAMGSGALTPLSLTPSEGLGRQGSCASRVSVVDAAAASGQIGFEDGGGEGDSGLQARVFATPQAATPVSPAHGGDPGAIPNPIDCVLDDFGPDLDFGVQGLSGPLDGGVGRGAVDSQAAQAGDSAGGRGEGEAARLLGTEQQHQQALTGGAQGCLAGASGTTASPGPTLEGGVEGMEGKLTTQSSLLGKLFSLMGGGGSKEIRTSGADMPAVDVASADPSGAHTTQPEEAPAPASTQLRASGLQAQAEVPAQAATVAGPPSAVPSGGAPADAAARVCDQQRPVQPRLVQLANPQPGKTQQMVDSSASGGRDRRQLHTPGPQGNPAPQEHGDDGADEGGGSGPIVWQARRNFSGSAATDLDACEANDWQGGATCISTPPSSRHAAAAGSAAAPAWPARRAREFFGPSCPSRVLEEVRACVNACDACAESIGLIVLGMHRDVEGPGLIGGHRHNVLAVMEPGAEAALLRDAVAGPTQPCGTQGEAAGTVGRQGGVDTSASLSEALADGAFVQTRDGSGRLLRCSVRSQHELRDAAHSVKLTSMLVHEYVPEHLFSVEDIDGVCAGSAGAVVLSVCRLQEEVCRQVCESGAAMVVYPQAGAELSDSGEDLAACVAEFIALLRGGMHVRDILRPGKRCAEVFTCWEP